MHQGTQRVARNTVTVANIPYICTLTIRNLGIGSSPQSFFLSPRGGHERRKILVDFYSYGYETAIFTLGAPHEEA